MSRIRADESGQVASIEVLPFGILTFVVGALLIANAWAVIDAKLAVSAAAREATRAFVEAPVGDDPLTHALALADAAARSAVEGVGRNPDELVLTALEATFARCETVRFQASYQIPAIRVPWVGGFGSGFTVTARHAEVVDPYRTGLPRSVNGCRSAL